MYDITYKTFCFIVSSLSCRRVNPIHFECNENAAAYYRYATTVYLSNATFYLYEKEKVYENSAV